MKSKVPLLPPFCLGRPWVHRIYAEKGRGCGGGALTWNLTGLKTNKWNDFLEFYKKQAPLLPPFCLGRHWAIKYGLRRKGEGNVTKVL